MQIIDSEAWFMGSDWRPFNESSFALPFHLFGEILENYPSI